MLRSLASGLIAALVAASAASAAPQKDKPGKMPLPPPPPGFVEPTQAQLDALLVDPKHLAWREDAKLGIAVHWGPVSLTGAPMSWGRLGERPGAGKPATNGVPAKEYDLLYRRFNPEKFDAAQWIDLFKRAGAGSFVFTTKHHDGFCMWDSALTDYDIMSTPFGRDVTAELAEAAHERDLKIIWYHSQPDWTHPDALREQARPQSTGDHNATAVRDGDWKLIHWHDADRDDLFNLADDISESTDVSADHPGEAKRLRALLDAWLEDIDAVEPKNRKKKS